MEIAAVTPKLEASVSADVLMFWAQIGSGTKLLALSTEACKSRRGV